MDEKLEVKYKNFLEKLQKLSEETGVYIEPFGDSFYDPMLTINVGENRKSNESIAFLHYDFDDKKYIVKKECPYDGDEIK